MKETTMSVTQDSGATLPVISEVKIALIYGVLLSLASYGMLYFAYKYYIPWIGGDDFTQYYNMYLSPFELDKAEAPFIYRQFGAFITNTIYELGISYPGKISFSDDRYDQAVFFAAILSNYLALLLTAIVTSLTVRRLNPRSPHIYPLMGGLLCFMAFYAQQGVLTGLVEGWAWCLVAVAFYGYASRNIWIVFVALALSVMQRETIPILFLTLSAMDWLLSNSKEKKVVYAKVGLIAVAACVAYFIIRTLLLSAPGHEYQLSLPSLISSLIDSFPPSRDLLFQGVMAQNSYFILLVLFSVNVVISSKRGFGESLRSSFIVQITVALIVLQLLGLATGIGNNIGRIAAILTPIIAVCIIKQAVFLEEASASRQSLYRSTDM